MNFVFLSLNCRWRGYLSGAIIILLASSTTGLAQSVNKFRREAQYLRDAVLKDHFNPHAIDDTFSADVYKTFLDELDSRKLYFMESDFDKIKKYETSLDDELNGKSWVFLDEASALYKKALTRSEGIINDILQKPFSWQKEDSLRRDSLQWAKSEEQYYQQWVRWLKYKTLDKLYKARNQLATDDASFISKNEPGIRKKLLNYEIQQLHRILDHPLGFENYVANAFFKTIASRFDPHTTYLSIVDVANFLSSVSTEGYSFGLVLEENEEGEVIISHLVPGGPAWKSGELHTSDVLTYIHRTNQEPVDLYGMDAEEVTKMLEEDGFNYMELTIRNKSGVEKTVRLRKEKIQLEENVVRSVILEGKEKRIGYISLPGFYADMGDEGGRCANDVAKEVVKLNKEKIDGLILDIRYNGGGSMAEALDMAGIFIDEGPLGVLKTKDGKLVTLKDNNRGTVYDGPLLVMVNKLSASASEFLAAALQDYHRAVIVGACTYGKATAQRLFPLSPAARPGGALLDNKGSGYLKITLEKIYRVTGKTAQKRGIIPDVILPDVLDGLKVGEAYEPNALPADSIDKRTYCKPLRPLPVKALRDSSIARTDTSQIFKKITSISQFLQQNYSGERYTPLVWGKFVQYKQKPEQELGVLESVLEMRKIPYTVANHASDLKRMEVDEFMAEMNKQWVKNLSGDVYLAEAFRIICDYIVLVNR